MKSPRFSDEQIIGMIKEQEAGMPTGEVCRKHGISTASFYKYKAKFGGMEVSDARNLKALEDENTKLKKLLAEQMLDNAMLKKCKLKKRGSQYCAHDYQKRLRQLGFKPSMSGKGNCNDNAVVETFFKTLKAELIWRNKWKTRDEVTKTVQIH